MDDLRTIREAAGLTQTELARATGVTQSMIGRIETGKTGPGADLRSRIEATLGQRFEFGYASCELAPKDPRHGTVDGYNNFRCRCGPCRNAWRIYHAGHGYQGAYRDRKLAGQEKCSQPDCDHKPDRAYLTGYCHRHNIEFGVKLR